MSSFYSIGIARTVNSDHEFNGKLKFTLTYLLQTTDPNDNFVDAETYVYNQTGLTTGVTWGSLPALCKHVKCNREAEDGLTWVVTAEFEPLENNTNSDNPITQPAQISWDFAQFETPTDVCADGQTAIVNSAGDPFAEPVTRDVSRLTLTIEQAEASYNPALAFAYIDTVNNNTFMGCNPGTVKCASINGKRKYNWKYGYYYEISYSFHFRSDGWQKVILDQGFRHLDTNTGNRADNLINQARATSPVLLDGNGGVLAPDGTPVWLTFNLYQTTAFNFTFRT